MTDLDQSTSAATAPSGANLVRALKAAAILWIVWGLAHIAFGVFGLTGFLGGNVVETMKAMLGGADPKALEVTYPEALVGLLNQHSWNLLWFGVFTTVGGVLIWRKNAVAIVVTAIVGGAADAGYFLFVDMAGFAAFPGPQLTWVSAAAILLSLFVYFRTNRLNML